MHTCRPRHTHALRRMDTWHAPHHKHTHSGQKWYCGHGPSISSLPALPLPPPVSVLGPPPCPADLQMPRAMPLSEEPLRLFCVGSDSSRPGLETHCREGLCQTHSRDLQPGLPRRSKGQGPFRAGWWNPRAQGQGLGQREGAGRCSESRLGSWGGAPH